MLKELSDQKWKTETSSYIFEAGKDYVVYRTDEAHIWGRQSCLGINEQDSRINVLHFRFKLKYTKLI